MPQYRIWMIFQKVYKSLHKSEAWYEFYNHIVNLLLWIFTTWDMFEDIILKMIIYNCVNAKLMKQ